MLAAPAPYVPLLVSELVSAEASDLPLLYARRLGVEQPHPATVVRRLHRNQISPATEAPLAESFSTSLRCC